MKATIGGFLLTLLLQGQSCSFNRPDQIKNDAERELHEYFPRAVVMVSPQREAIFGFTCATSLGESAITALKPLVDESPAVQQLKQAIRRSPSAQTYRQFALGFEKYVIRLNLDQDQSQLVPTTEIEDYNNLYAQHCGSQQNVADTQQQGAGYIWLAVFEIAAEWSDGLKRTFVSKDTLGIYTEADFDLARDEEIKHREQIIRWFLGEQEIKLISIQLKAIEKIDLDKERPR